MHTPKNHKSRVDPHEFHQARRGYSPAIIDMVTWYANGPYFSGLPGRALDVGCGTGIGTEQLDEAGWASEGVDADDRMIAFSRKTHPLGKLRYQVASARRLPHKDESFQLIASFGAFHWFANREVLEEFKRVLVPNGTVCVVHKRTSKTDSFDTVWRAILAHYINETPRGHQKNGYDPLKLFHQAGLVGVKTVQLLNSEEIYTIEDAVLRVQTTVHWSGVLTHRQMEATRALRMGFASIAEPDGIVRRLITASMVCGHKS